MSSYSNDPIPFGVWDYVVFGGMLAISTLTGIYHGFAKGGQHSTSRYLLADRKMHYLPVAMSILVSFTSPIAMMGTPAEVFVHGIGYVQTLSAGLVHIPLVAYIFVPVFHDITLTSVYEYMELRFNFALRILVATIFMLQSVFYIAACLIGPALAIEAVIGFEVWKTIVITGVLCTTYTTLGGMKGVIWTDVFQFFVMIGTIVAVIVIAVMKAGGMDEVIRVNSENGRRLNGASFDFDPTRRLTVFTTLIGAVFTYSPSFVSQTAVQRYMTLPSVKQSQASLLLNLPLLYFVIIALCFTGQVLFAFYNNNPTPLQPAINATVMYDLLPTGDTDPRYAPNFSTADQILVYFVSSQLGEIPGIQGLFIAGLFAGTLSSASSSLNAMTAVTLEDFIKTYRKWRGRKPGRTVYENDERDTIVSKILTCVYGMAGIGVGFLVIRVGSLLVLASTIFGVTGGPIIATFGVGMLYKRAHGIETLLGTLLGFGFGLWVSLGAYVHHGASGEVPAIYRLSFLMYAAYGATITILVSILGSEVINFFVRRGNIKYVHPLLLARCVRPTKWKTRSGHMHAEQDSEDPREVNEYQQNVRNVPGRQASIQGIVGSDPDYYGDTSL